VTIITEEYFFNSCGLCVEVFGCACLSVTNSLKWMCDPSEFDSSRFFTKAFQEPSLFFRVPDPSPRLPKIGHAPSEGSVGSDQIGGARGAPAAVPVEHVVDRIVEVPRICCEEIPIETIIERVVKVPPRAPPRMWVRKMIRNHPKKAAYKVFVIIERLLLIFSPSLGRIHSRAVCHVSWSIRAFSQPPFF